MYMYCERLGIMTSVSLKGEGKLDALHSVRVASVAPGRLGRRADRYGKSAPITEENPEYFTRS